MSDSVAQTKPLKVLLVIETGGGGSGRHFIDLAAALVERGACVHAAYSPLRAEPGFVDQLRAIQGLRVEVLPMRRSPHPQDLQALWWLKGYIRRHGFDVVHGHSSKAGALVRLASLFGKARRIYTPHAVVTMNPNLGRAGRLAFGLIERLLGAVGTDTLIAVSEDELDHVQRLGIPRSRLALVKNGVVPVWCDRGKGARPSMREALGAEDDDVVVGWVGRLSAQKAPERFVSLAQRLVADHPKVRFVMLGEGELASVVDAQIRATGLNDRLVRIERARGVDYMPAFDVLVMTSRYEAMSYVLIEALDAGLPLVAMEVGGARTAIEHGRNGFVVPNSDRVDQLALGVAKLVDDTDLRRKMGAASFEKSREFHIDRMVSDTLEVYLRGGSVGRSNA